MTTAVDARFFGHGALWTEAEYLELGETPDRVELFDGSLVVTPSPIPNHQHISRRLANAFDGPATPVGLQVYLAINLRLKTNRLSIPDLVVVRPIDRSVLVVDASSVELVCEITSPSNAATDRVLKMHYYSEANIPWYLLIEPRPDLSMKLFRLQGGKYVPAAEASHGETLRMTEPFEVELDAAGLER